MRGVTAFMSFVVSLRRCYNGLFNSDGEVNSCKILALLQNVTRLKYNWNRRARMIWRRKLKWKVIFWNPWCFKLTSLENVENVAGLTKENMVLKRSKWAAENNARWCSSSKCSKNKSSKIILFMMFISSMDLLDHVTNEALDMRDFPMITK